MFGKLSNSLRLKPSADGELTLVSLPDSCQIRGTITTLQLALAAILQYTLLMALDDRWLLKRELNLTAKHIFGALF